VTITVAKKTVAAPPQPWSIGELPPGQYVELIVSDTGIGMTEDIQAQIFEPFFTTKGVGKGTGLGLSTVYGIVEQSGGHISVASTPGGGSTFTVSIPAVSDRVMRPAESSTPKSAAAGSETILLVEDEPAVRSLTRNALVRQGYRVIEAGSGSEACEAAEKQNLTIDLVLTDVVMPGISGPELVRRLRASHPEMKAIYMSGYHDDALLRHRVRTNEAPFLPKPFLPRDVVQIVHQTLTGCERPRTGEGPVPSDSSLQSA